jgi:heptaprenyl diphosphate synthase
LARASEIAAGLGTEVAGLLARTIGWLCEGQIEELRHTYDVGRTEESYLASIHGKTASLYGTAARVGGIVAGLSDEEIDALTDFGNAYGMVFQVVDDLLDLTATDERLGKRAGHDMEVGVYTLPVIHTLSVGSAELESLLGGPLHGPEAERALEIVRSGPGIESTISRARDFVNDAVRACSALPEGPARSALEEAPAALLASALSPTA